MLVSWVPVDGCRVEYGEFTNQGRLKYATSVSLTGAKAPAECRTEDAHG